LYEAFSNFLAHHFHGCEAKKSGQLNMSIFDGIERVDAEGAFSRRYFEQGNYVVTIQSVYLFEKRLGGGKLFIVETTIDESDNPNIKVGEQRNWVQSFALPSALPRIKTFIGAAIGICPQRQLKQINEKVTKEICEGVVSVNNPLHGKKVKLLCTSKTTQKGKDFVQHAWGCL
jgi:hypothetical protein